MSSLEVIADILKAKEYVDKAIHAGTVIFERDDLEHMLDAIEAMEYTAIDLQFEAWRLKMTLWSDMGKIDPAWKPSPSFMGTRSIPDV